MRRSITPDFDPGAEASGFNGNARLGRTGHKERTPWLVGQVGSKGR